MVAAFVIKAKAAEVLKMAERFRDPLAIIAKYESGGNYFIGVQGKVVGGVITPSECDLTLTPRNALGFPLWAGKGNSHAAGKYQFQPATWAFYAERLDIKDFSPLSQEIVAAAAWCHQSFAPWAPFDPPLAAAIEVAGGAKKFSIAASILAAMQNPPSAVDPAPSAPIEPPSVPPSIPPVPPSSGQLEITATDSATGRTWSGAIKTIVVGLCVGVLIGVVTCCAPSPPPKQIASLAPAAELPARDFWLQYQPSFRLVPGPLGEPLAVPIVRK